MKNISLLILIVAGVLISSCSGSEKETKKQAGAKVKATTVESSSNPKVYDYTGIVQAQKQSAVATRLMGQVEQILVEKGDRVKKGDLLISIRSNAINAKEQQVEAGIAEATAAFENVETNFRRIKTLYDKESATQKEFDDIKTQYKMAEARLEAAKQRRREVDEMLQYANIRSPYDGTVINKFVNTGDMASPGMPLLAIEAPGAFEVLSRIPESEMNLWSAGDTAMVEISSVEETVKGVITNISPSSKFSGPQYEILIGLMPDEGQASAVKSGMFANVKLHHGTEQVIEVPSDLIVKRGQLTGIWMVSPQDKALMRWIRPGRELNGKTEILSGVKSGERYITEHDARLYDGILVEVN
ncbi:efflux RND transporter periplasmic adaptor subunit [Marinilabilia rubra]|uniref:Efflux RND transporter periplasmic adaptor subunit n=1 Tax=Marinilabilia rubra TaxID=2162893 RepID=A0A2U2B5N9_9BACT|nr:efflux RND transporter periplasmic adaptor subunit [Marinilabilia rubra]PWD98390.1 efflux RND transporter periplasmic adaptor subunit [Marinilabilia rubra]